MEGIFNTIKIGNTEVELKEIVRPSGFEIKTESVYAAEYTTLKGETRADYIGWKYADMALHWGILTEAQMKILFALKSEGYIAFEGPRGVEEVEKIIRKNSTIVATRWTDTTGKKMWKDVNVEVSFINVHY